jgi:hypothetical protein
MTMNYTLYNEEGLTFRGNRETESLLDATFRLEVVLEFLRMLNS